MAGKIKELLHIGLFKYIIGLLGAIGISFSNFLQILAKQLLNASAKSLGSVISALLSTILKSLLLVCALNLFV